MTFRYKGHEGKRMTCINSLRTWVHHSNALMVSVPSQMELQCKGLCSPREGRPLTVWMTGSPRGWQRSGGPECASFLQTIEKVSVSLLLSSASCCQISLSCSPWLVWASSVAHGASLQEQGDSVSLLLSGWDLDPAGHWWILRSSTNTMNCPASIG